MYKIRPFKCPGCGRHLLRAKREPPCSVCGWAGKLAEYAPKWEANRPFAFKVMVVLAIINFAAGIYVGFLAFWHDPFWLIWFVGGNSAIYAYAIWKFGISPWRKKRGQKKSV